MPINAGQLIEQNFLQAKWRADQERKEEAQNRLDLYMDDYEEIIRSKMAELFHKDNYKRLYYHVNQSQNVLKRVVDEISAVYKVPAVRTLSAKNDRWNDIAAGLNLDEMGARVNCYANLLNEVLLKVGVRGGRVVLDILTPNVCMVVQNEDDPTQADAIVYMRTLVNTLGSSDIDYHYWSVEGDYWIFDNDFRVKAKIFEGNSPYRRKDGSFALPFIVIHRRMPDSAFWDQDSGRDLYNGAVLIGVKMTLFDYYFKVASIKQPYIIGDNVEVPGEQVCDPLTIFTASGQNAQIGLLDMQINMGQLKDALVFQLNSLINNYGISADQWSLVIAETSGRALKIRNRALLESREKQRPSYIRAEKDIFDTVRIVNNAHFKDQIPEDVELTVDHGEIEFPEEPAVELQLEKDRLKSGLISLGQFYQHFNPNEKDEKKAQEKIIENLRLLREVQAQNPDIDELLNNIISAGSEKKAAAAGEGEGEEEE